MFLYCSKDVDFCSFGTKTARTCCIFVTLSKQLLSIRTCQHLLTTSQVEVLKQYLHSQEGTLNFLTGFGPFVVFVKNRWVLEGGLESMTENKECVEDQCAWHDILFFACQSSYWKTSMCRTPTLFQDPGYATVPQSEEPQLACYTGAIEVKWWCLARSAHGHSQLGRCRRSDVLLFCAQRREAVLSLRRTPERDSEPPLECSRVYEGEKEGEGLRSRDSDELFSAATGRVDRAKAIDQR